MPRCQSRVGTRTPNFFPEGAVAYVVGGGGGQYEGVCVLFFPSGCSSVTPGSFFTRKPLGSHSSLWLKRLRRKINNPFLAGSTLIRIKNVFFDIYP